MSRRRRAVRRPVQPDPKFQSTLVSTLVNTVMKNGKKSLAQRIVYDAIDKISAKNPDSDPLEILKRAVDNAKPRLEVKARRVGGATYQVPVEVRSDRAQALAFRWLIQAARSRPENTMEERLAGELVDAVNARGTAVKKREDTHKMAEANRAFSHYRW